jgi:hypothetical protein
MKLIFAVLAILAISIDRVNSDCNDEMPLPSGFHLSDKPFVYPREDNCVECSTITPFCFLDCHSFTAVDKIETDDYGDVTLNTFYGVGNASVFVTACEELWACTDYVTQYGEAISETTGTRRELCFNEAYESGGLTAEAGAEDLLNSKKNFILSTCHGIDEGQTVSERLDELLLKRDTACSAAEGYARRASWSLDITTLPDDLKTALTVTDIDPEDDLCGEDNSICKADANCTCYENAELCISIATCVRAQVQTLFDGGFTIPNGGKTFDFSDYFGDGEEILSDEAVYDLCWNVDLEELRETNDTVCDEGLAGACSSYEWPSGNGGCRSEPFCPTAIAGQFKDFGPAYPTSENEIYTTLIASIKETFMCNHLPVDGVTTYYDRTSADAYGIVAILKAVFQSILVPAEIIKDSLPDDWLYSWKVAPYVALTVIINALDTVLNQADYHDSLIDGAEIEAIYENTRQLLDGSAAIYDEVVCRCVKNMTTISTTNLTITSPVRRGMGCNGQDDNCDQSIDDW